MLVQHHFVGSLDEALSLSVEEAGDALAECLVGINNENYKFELLCYYSHLGLYSMGGSEIPKPPMVKGGLNEFGKKSVDDAWNED